MKMNKKSSRAIYIKESIVLLITLIIVPINSRPRRSRVTLNTLNVRNILTDLKAETALLPPLKIIISMIEIITIHPSNKFILSLAYPINFNQLSYI